MRSLQGGDEAIAILRERPPVERQEIVVDQLVEAALADGKPPLPARPPP